MNKQNKTLIAIGLIVLAVAGIIFGAVYFGTDTSSGKVRFRTSDLSYSHVFETAESSIGYAVTDGAELTKFGLSTYAEYQCDQMAMLTYLFNIPGVLDGQPVKLYSYGAKQLYVCSGNSAVVYSTTVANDATVETSAEPIDSSREVLW